MLANHFQKILFLVLLIALFPYLYISQFANPIADDYCYSVLGRDTDLWSQWWNQYMTWNGRYASNILVLLNPMVFGSLFVYKLMSFLQIIFSFFSIYYFLRSVTGRAFSFLITINASLLLLLLYLFQMPVLAEGIYGFNCAVSYQTGICFSLIYFSFLHSYVYRKYLFHKNVHLVLSVALLVFCLGFDEVLTLIIMGIHLAIAFLISKNNKYKFTLWWLFLGICLICTSAMVLAPGNSVRDSYYTDNHNFLHSLLYTFMQTFRFGFTWISNLPFLFSSFLFAAIIISNKEKFSFFRKEYFFKPRASVLLLFLILFLCIFPAYWGTKILGQHRTVNVAYFFFILYWFLCIGVYSLKYSERLKFDILFSKKLQVVFVLLIVGAIATTNNGYDIFTDILYQRTTVFDTQMQDRFIYLSRQENKGKVVKLKPLSEKPKSLFILDLLPDSTNWINDCQARYFGVKSIICKE